MKIISLVLCCVVSCFSNQILAQSIDTQALPDGIRAQYIGCIYENKEIEVNLKQCITDELAYQNKYLEDIYNQLMTVLNKKQAKKLTIAQQAWLDQSNKDQDFETSIYKNAENELAQAHLYRVAQRAYQIMTVMIMSDCCTRMKLEKRTVNFNDSYAGGAPTPKGIRKEFVQCLKENDGSDIRSLDLCMATIGGDDDVNEGGYQEDRLNAQYKKLVSLLNSEQKKKLIVAQKAWKMQQDKNSDFQNVVYEDLFVYTVVKEDADIYQMADRANWLANAIHIVKNNGAQK